MAGKVDGILQILIVALLKQVPMNFAEILAAVDSNSSKISPRPPSDQATVAANLRLLQKLKLIVKNREGVYSVNFDKLADKPRGFPK